MLVSHYLYSQNREKPASVYVYLQSVSSTKSLVYNKFSGFQFAYRYDKKCVLLPRLPFFDFFILFVCINMQLIMLCFLRLCNAFPSIILMIHPWAVISQGPEHCPSLSLTGFAYVVIVLVSRAMSVDLHPSSVGLGTLVSGSTRPILSHKTGLSSYYKLQDFFTGLFTKLFSLCYRITVRNSGGMSGSSSVVCH